MRLFVTPSPELRAEDPVFWDFAALIEDRVAGIGARFGGSLREAQDVIEDDLWIQSANGTRAISDEMIEQAWRRSKAGGE